MKVGTRFDVAVFPIPDAVLFPGTTLPLQILERRYGQMLKDIRSRGWLLAVSLVEPRGPNPKSSEYLLNTLCGAGEVQVFREYPDGSSDILVHGRRRIRLRGFVQREPYFVMEAEVLESHPSREELEHFRSLVKAWTFLQPSVEDGLAPIFDEFDDSGELADFFAFHFLKKPSEKQRYLNIIDPSERAGMLARFLTADLGRVSRRLIRRNRGSSLLVH